MSPQTMKDYSKRDSAALAMAVFPKMSAFSRIVHHVHSGQSTGLTPQQIKVIMELDHVDSLRLSDLSQCACVTHGTMTVAVQKLLKKGLLVRKKDPSDERAIRLGLSARGKTVAGQTRAKMVEVFDFICQELSAKDRKKLRESYEFLLNTYQDIVHRKVLKSHV